MATYNMPESVKSLVPIAVLDKVQNGLDTVFSEALSQEAGSKWRAKAKKDGFKIGNTLKRTWEVKNNAPGKFLVFCIGVDNLTDDVGEFKFDVPAFASEWFGRLAA